MDKQYIETKNMKGTCYLEEKAEEEEEERCHMEKQTINLAELLYISEKKMK